MDGRSAGDRFGGPMRIAEAGRVRVPAMTICGVKYDIAVSMSADDLPHVALRRGSRVAPRLPTKNQYWRLVKRGHASMVHSQVAVAFWTALAKHVARHLALRTEEVEKGGHKYTALASPLLRTGWLALRIRTYAKGQTDRLGDVMVPNLDCDAVVSPLMDALTRARIIDDDARIQRVESKVFYDPDGPRLEFELCPLSDPREEWK